jgi:cold shock CspA family protein
MAAWKAGKVLWFDKLSGEGMVVDAKGTTYYVHYTAIDKAPKQKKRKNLASDGKVEFKVYENSYIRQIEKFERSSLKQNLKQIPPHELLAPTPRTRNVYWSSSLFNEVYLQNDVPKAYGEIWPQDESGPFSQFLSELDRPLRRP